MSRTALRLGLAFASTGVALLIAWFAWRAWKPTSLVDVPRDAHAPGFILNTDGPPGSQTYRADGDASAKTFRIYLVGGSTAAGCPFEDRLDFGRIVAWLFDGQMGERAIEVRNYAGSGEDSIYELEDAKRILEVEDDPANAVLLLYTGINEFVRHDSAQDLSLRQRKLFDEPLVPADKARQILDDFEKREREIVSSMRAKGIQVIVSTAAVNLVDWEPERSVLADPAHAEPMKALLDKGDDAQARGDLETALVAHREAHELEPHFAWASFQLGRTLRGLGHFDEARGALQAAVDDNAAPNAAVSRQNRFLRELARESGSPLVDGEALVRDAAPNGLPGYESFWDNCHPTLATYLHIAQGFARELSKLRNVPLARENATEKELAKALEIDESYLARLCHVRGQYFYTASALIWNPTQRLAQSREYLARAASAFPNDAQIACSLGVLHLFRDDPKSSLVEWRRAQALDAEVVKQRLKHKFVRGLLKRNGIEDGSAWVSSDG